MSEGGKFGFSFRRIPLYFVVDAAESVKGRITDQIMSGGAGVSQVTLGLVNSALSSVPGLGVPKTDLSFKNKLVIPMIVNPSQMSLTRNPRVNKVLTKRGILNQYWQADPDTLSFTGRAASDRSMFIFNQLESVIKTTETGTRNLVTIIYKFGGVYNGYVENFRTSIDAEQPNVFDYSFDFQFADKRHFSIFLFTLRTNAINEAIRYPGKFMTDQWRIGAAEMKTMSGISLGGKIL